MHSTPVGAGCAGDEHRVGRGVHVVNKQAATCTRSTHGNANVVIAVLWKSGRCGAGGAARGEGLGAKGNRVIWVGHVPEMEHTLAEARPYNGAVPIALPTVYIPLTARAHTR